MIFDDLLENQTLIMIFRTEILKIFAYFYKQCFMLTENRKLVYKIKVSEWTSGPKDDFKNKQEYDKNTINKYRLKIFRDGETFS